MSETFQFSTASNADVFPIRATFMEAWDDMYKWVKAQIESGLMSVQLLESFIWIEITKGNLKSPIYFYDARDRAIDQFGWKKP